jgi:two-component system phosphate regulon sensor histidine kinase PhoR
VGDRDQVVQVVQNLVDNALTYSPEGGEVRIVVGEAASLPALDALRDPVLAQSSATARLTLAEPDRTRASGGYVFVRVSDRGAGLARQHLPRLAERFYRVEGQKSGAGARPGTGLGLAIVKHIVHRHRGGLIVESAPGEGSAFTAYFPAEGR